MAFMMTSFLPNILLKLICAHVFDVHIIILLFIGVPFLIVGIFLILRGIQKERKLKNEFREFYEEELVFDIVEDFDEENWAKNQSVDESDQRIKINIPAVIFFLFLIFVVMIFGAYGLPSLSLSDPAQILLLVFAFLFIVVTVLLLIYVWYRKQKGKIDEESNQEMKL